MRSKFTKLVLVLGVFLLTLPEFGHAGQKKPVKKTKPAAATSAKPAAKASSKASSQPAASSTPRSTDSSTKTPSLAETIDLTGSTGDSTDSEGTPDTVRDIILEATKPNFSADGRPLPLIRHWQTGFVKTNRPDLYGSSSFIDPLYQLELIEAGHHILPGFYWWTPYQYSSWLTDEQKLIHYETAIKKYAEWGMPITFLAAQWELLLSDPAYITVPEDFFHLPAAENPNVIALDGTIQKKVSPFGAVDPWMQAGRLWTDNPVMKRLQEWYPNPPLVLFISNNEHAKPHWREALTLKRFVDKFGTDFQINGPTYRETDRDFVRKVFADGWRERYGALQEAMTNGLVAPVWKNHVRYVGYEVGNLPHLGRWTMWQDYFDAYPEHVSPESEWWNGGSNSYYLNGWQADLADFRVFSPQVEAMNDRFYLDQVLATDPGFWHEISVWDGYLEEPSDTHPDKRQWYESIGQSFSPERYGAWVRFGMWVMRPRVVREFRGTLTTQEEVGPKYFEKLMQAVDEIYDNETLKRFWRRGQLVANTTGEHPYQHNIPDEFADGQRWYLLSTNLDPARPWTLTTEIPVFAIALELGEGDAKEYLIYAYSPTQNRQGVEITLPGHGTVTLDVPVGGVFHHVASDTPFMTSTSFHRGTFISGQRTMP